VRSFGLVAMLGSAFLFSIMALQVKWLAQFGTFQLVFWRSVFMLAGTMAVLVYRGESPIGPSGDWLVLIARGVAGFAFMSAFYSAIKLMPLSDAIVITYTSPVITGIAAAVLLGEAWGVLDAIGSVLSFVGVVLISKPAVILRWFGLTDEASTAPFAGTMAALAAAFLSSSVYLLLRYAKNLDAVLSVNYFAFVGAVLAPMFSYASGEAFKMPQGFEWIELASLAAISIVGQVLMNVGLAHETAGKATAMNYAQVVFAYIYQIALFHKSSDLLSIVGAILIASWGGFALIKELLRVQVPPRLLVGASRQEARLLDAD